jgi:hypothetical protein
VNEFRFEAEITPGEAVLADVVRERVYGAVRVTAEWPETLATPVIRVAVEVSGDVDRRDAPAYAELFFHDVFLLLNLAAPGSFGGTISISGGELRVRALAFSPRVFDHASGRVPLDRVMAWYDALHLGTRQVATGGPAVALFELLHLARAEEDEEVAVLRLARAAEALVEMEALARLFELRDDIARGRTPVFHPLHDDALDPTVLDATREWIEVADQAAGLIIDSLQTAILRYKTNNAPT